MLLNTKQLQRLLFRCLWCRPNTSVLHCEGPHIPCSCPDSFICCCVVLQVFKQALAQHPAAVESVLQQYSQPAPVLPGPLQRLQPVIDKHLGQLVRQWRQGVTQQSRWQQQLADVLTQVWIWDHCGELPDYQPVQDVQTPEVIPSCMLAYTQHMPHTFCVLLMQEMQDVHAKDHQAAQLLQNAINGLQYGSPRSLAMTLQHFTQVQEAVQGGKQAAVSSLDLSTLSGVMHVSEAGLLLHAIASGLGRSLTVSTGLWC